MGVFSVDFHDQRKYGRRVRIREDPTEKCLKDVKTPVWKGEEKKTDLFIKQLKSAYNWSFNFWKVFY